MAWVILVVSGVLEAGWALSLAYAVWTGIGASVTAVVAVSMFDEPMGVIKIVSLVLIVAGIVGLNISAPAAA